MRYDVIISLRYVAGGIDYPGDARDSLAAEVGVQVAAHHPGTVDGLEVAVAAGATVLVRATLGGADPHRLTSPLDALSRFDAAVLRALAVTGQFEEFDVVRRSVEARPAT